MIMRWVLRGIDHHQQRMDAQMTSDRLSRTVRNHRFFAFSLAVLGLGGITTGVAMATATSGSPAKTTTTSALARPHRPVATAQQAIAIAEEDPGVQGVTRSAAKLTTFAQALSAGSPAASVRSPESPSAHIWVVALAGTVHPGFSLVPEIDTLEAVLIDQHTGSETGLIAGRTGDWPPFFDTLPDLSNFSAAASPVAPSTTSGGLASPSYVGPITQAVTYAGTGISLETPPSAAQPSVSWETAFREKMLHG